MSWSDGSDAHRDRHEAAARRGAAPVPLSPSQLEHVEHLMANRLEDELRLEDLAAATHMSKYHFARSYKAATGITPMHRLTELRMRRAREMLRTTAMPVGVVADRCGYRTPGGFSAAFLRHHGVRPSAFRRHARSEAMLEYRNQYATVSYRYDDDR